MVEEVRSHLEAGDPPLPIGRQLAESDIGGEVLESVVRQGDPVGVERVGLHQIGAGVQVRPVDLDQQLGSRESEHVVRALEGVVVTGETTSPEVGLAQPVRLDHGAHGAVEDEDPPREVLVQQGDPLCAGEWSCR